MATRQVRLESFLHNGECPASYVHNTPSEEKVIVFVDEFWSVYHAHCPDRRPLLLTSSNECGQRKMICTFIRPSVLQYDELHDAESCSKYVAGYIQYEALCDPEDYQNSSVRTVEKLPSQVVSPSTVLAWQVGNCFELSLLLTSLLIGAGYRAYTVVGHAHPRVCLNDQSKTNWPGTLPVEVNSDDDEAEEVPIDEEYAALLAPPPTLRQPAGVNVSSILNVSSIGGSSSSSSENVPAVLGPNTAARASRPGHPCNERDTIHGTNNSIGRDLSQELAPAEEIKPVHSWVMLLPGGRKHVKEAMFIEPAVGELIPVSCADAFYTGIESVFDDKNYYVNLHPDALVSGIAPNLSNNLQWENVLLTDKVGEDSNTDTNNNDAAACVGNAIIHTAPAGATGNVTPFAIPSSTRRPVNDLLNTGTTSTSTTAGIVIASANKSTAAIEAVMRTRAEVPMSWVSELTLSREQYETRYANGGYKTIEYADAVVRLYSDLSQSDLRVQEIVLSRPQQLHHKHPYPQQSFSAADDDNVIGVMPVSLSGMSMDTQVHIFYKHRGDKLRRRSMYKNNNNKSLPATDATATTQSQLVVHEWYESCNTQGKKAIGLREFIHEPGVHRTMKFYWRSRDDGLFRRVELFYDGECALRKVKEYYRGRDDRLRYRSATFARPETEADTSMHRAIIDPVSASFAYSSSSIDVASTPGMTEMNSITCSRSNMCAWTHLEPRRMSEQYDRNISVDASADVAKIAFTRHPSPNNIDIRGEIWVYFHFGTDTIIRPYHVFAKPSSKVEDYIAAAVTRRPVESVMKVVTLPGSKPPTELELFYERKWLHRKEADCLAAVHTHMDECVRILCAMNQEQRVVTKVLSSYDTLRNRSNESEAQRVERLAAAMRREESRQDYLAPYIAKLRHTLPTNFDGNYTQVQLTQEQARQVRDEALHDAKERLIQRGNIMQEHLNREREELNRRKQQSQKNRDTNGVAGTKNTDDFSQHCDEASWRIKVLEERLARHVDQSSEKYEELARRLSEDSRLSKLYNDQPTAHDTA